MASSQPLPQSLKPYFWDYAFSKLSLINDRDLIIRRVLTNGSWEAITWLRKKIGVENVKQWLVAHQGRGLSPQQLRYWGLVLDLPVGQVDRWVKAAKEFEWNKK